MIALALLAAVQAAPLAEQYKLILSANQGGIIALDYPTKARCEAARLSIEAQTAERLSKALERLGNVPKGVQAELTSTPLIIAAICIPA